MSRKMLLNLARLAWQTGGCRSPHGGYTRAYVATLGFDPGNGEHPARMQSFYVFRALHDSGVGAAAHTHDRPGDGDCAAFVYVYR
jgi:hypothetical protein